MLKVETINNDEATIQHHDRGDNWAFQLTDDEVAGLINALSEHRAGVEEVLIFDLERKAW